MQTNHLLLVLSLLLVGLTSLNICADQIPPKIETMQESEIKAQQTIPKELYGTWYIDEKATNELISKLNSKPTSQELSLAHLLMTEKKVSYELNENQFIIQYQNNPMIFDATLISVRDKTYELELVSNNSLSIGTLTLDEQQKLKITGAYFLGHELLLWKKDPLSSAVKSAI